MAEKVLLDTGCVLRCQENDIHMDYDGGRGRVVPALRGRIGLGRRRERCPTVLFLLR